MKTRGDCPFCGRKNKFCTFPATETYFCYGCRTWGWARDLGTHRPNRPTPSLQPKSGSSEPISVPLPGGFRTLNENGIAWNYLVGRGIDPAPLLPFIGWAHNYVIFPFYTKGAVLYYVGRKIWGGGPRYKNAEGPCPYLFVPYLMGPISDTLVIVEGVFDVLKVYQSTELPVVGLMGKEITNTKLALICQMTSPSTRVIVLLDPDARVTAAEYVNRLHGIRHCDLVTLKDKDPGDMSPSELQRLLLC